MQIAKIVINGDLKGVDEFLTEMDQEFHLVQIYYEANEEYIAFAIEINEKDSIDYLLKLKTRILSDHLQYEILPSSGYSYVE